MENIRRFRDDLTARYGKPLQRIPIDLALSCPHRAAGKGGCTFCPEDGARARQLRHVLDLSEQVRTGVEFARNRYGAEGPYIAYFQSYTNTFGEVSRLRKLYDEVLGFENFAMLIVSTRPDCLSDEVLDWLCSYRNRYEVWVELGIQSAHDRTLERINRGHNWVCSVSALRRLRERGLKSAAHLIAGLPGESLDDMRESALRLAELPLDGVKFHQLMVLKQTPMAKLFAEEPELFAVRNEYDYAHALGRMIRALPDNVSIMRLCADAPPERIIAPKWWMTKGQFQTFFESVFAARREGETAPLIETRDGSFTAFHPAFRQHFHTIAGAQTETQKRFIEPSALERKLQEKDVHILDIGFGLGYNALEAVRCAEKVQGRKVDIVSLENDPRVLPLAAAVPRNPSEKKVLQILFEKGEAQTPYAQIKLILGDGRQSLLKLSAPFDLVFLDPFSPDVNPELWTYDFLRLVSRKLSPDGIILTYSNAFPVLGALHRCGLQLFQTPAVGSKRGGIAASKVMLEIPPLRDKDLSIACHTLAGVVYRDPVFNLSPPELRRRREQTVERLKARGVPKWFTPEK